MLIFQRPVEVRTLHGSLRWPGGARQIDIIEDVLHLGNILHLENKSPLHGQCFLNVKGFLKCKFVLHLPAAVLIPPSDIVSTTTDTDILVTFTVTFVFTRLKRLRL